MMTSDLAPCSPSGAVEAATSHGGMPRRRLLLLAPTTLLLAACAGRGDRIPAEPTPVASSLTSTTITVSGLSLEVPETWTRERGPSKPGTSSSTETSAPEDEASEEQAPEEDTSEATILDAAVTWAARFVDGDGADTLLVSTVFPAADLDQASALSRALAVEALPGAVVRTSVDLGETVGEGPVRLILDRGADEAVATAWTAATADGYTLVLLLVDDDQVRNTIEESVKEPAT